MRQLLSFELFLIETLLAALLGVSAIAAPDYRLVPKLESEKAEQAHIERLREFMPDAFLLRGDARIYVTPELNIPEERAFLDWYLSSKIQATVEEESRPRPEFKQITFRVLSAQQQNTLSASAQALQEVEKTLRKISSKYSSTQEEVEEILRLHKKVGSLSSRGLIVGLTNCLPPAQRGAIFKMNDINDKISTLKKELTDSMVQNNFKGEGELTVKAKIAELEKVMDREDRMIELALHLYYEEQSRNITAIEKILHPKNRQEFADFLTKKLFPSLGDKEGRRFRELVMSNFKDVFGEVTEDKVEMWTHKASYKLVEVPPTIAIHRGCLNGDCFSKFAFAFAYAPSERTFILQNDRGENLASMYAMAVEYRDRPALYIHELGSPNINPEIAEWITRALHQNLRELGYEHMLITTKNMHWSAMQLHLQTLTNRQAVQFTISDAKTRLLIGDRMVEQMRSRLVSFGFGYHLSYAKEHDIAAAHTSAYVFEPQVGIYRIETQVRPAPDFHALLGMAPKSVRNCVRLF